MFGRILNPLQRSGPRLPLLLKPQRCPLYALFAPKRSIGFYRKKGWSLWRRYLWQRRQKHNFKKRCRIGTAALHPATRTENDREKAHRWQFAVHNLKLSRKNLALIRKLLLHLHLQDAIDWLCAIPRARLNPIYDKLVEIRDTAPAAFGADPARLYICGIRVEQGTPLRYVRYALGGVYTRYRSWQNTFHVDVVQIPLKQFFYRLYVLGKVPRSLSADMRLALREGHAPPFKLASWQPYICAASRRLHRRRLAFLHGTNNLDITAERERWIAEYQATLRAHHLERRRQRGLAEPGATP